MSRLATRSRKLAGLFVCLVLVPVDSFLLSLAGSQPACDEHGQSCRCRLACSRAEHQRAPKPQVAPSCHGKPSGQDSHLSEEASAPSKNTPAWTTCSRPKIDAAALDETVYLIAGLSIQADLTVEEPVGPEPSAVAALLPASPPSPPPRA